MTDKIIKDIVDTHNEFRNRIAQGREQDFKTATRMTTMVRNEFDYCDRWDNQQCYCFLFQRWDPELARLAKTHAASCELEHDKCRNTGIKKLLLTHLKKMWWIILFYIACFETKFLAHFIAAGQNINLYTYEGEKTEGFGYLFWQLVHRWFLEFEKTNMSIIDSYYVPPEWASLFSLISSH